MAIVSHSGRRLFAAIQLYRRFVDERLELVRNYAAAITRLVASILMDGVRRREFKIDDVEAAAEVARDAVTVYVHPAKRRLGQAFPVKPTYVASWALRL